MMGYIKKSLLGYLPFISVCIGIFLYTSVSANTASMDPNFYTNTPIGFNNPLNTMSIQNDGKILLGGGFTAYKGILINRMIRLKTDGTRDTSFSIGDGFNGDINTIAIQSDGKILVGGGFRVYDGIDSKYIVRLNPDGSRDTSFTIGSGFSHTVQIITLQSDGKILVGGGFSSYNGTTSNNIIRLNVDGTRDTSFIIGGGFNGSVSSIIPQSDGKILVGGIFSSYSGTTSNKIIRLNVDGSRDTSFTIGGGFNGGVNFITPQDDGKLVVGGDFTSYSGTTTNRLVRLNPNGTRDTSFDIGGGFAGSVYTCAIQSGGKILVGGIFSSYSGMIINRIIRLNTDGSRDTSFTIGSGFDGFVKKMLFQDDGKLLSLGGFSTYNGMPAQRITRLNTDGTHESFFGTGKGFDNYIIGLNVQNDGKFLVGGNFTTYNGTAINRLVRLNIDATRDTSFDIGSGFDNRVNVISTQVDGKVLVGGAFTTYQGINSKYFVRLHTNGSRDTSFDVGGGFNGVIFAIATQSDGKVLVGGAFNTYSGAAINRLVRLNTDGTIDSSFTIGAGFSTQVNALYIQDDGKIIVGGNFTSYSGAAANRIIRLNPNGTKDTGFTIGAGFPAAVEIIKVQSDGKILVGGNFTTYSGVAINRLVRLNPNGTRDTSFTTGAGFDSTVKSLVLQSDGKILVGGNFTTYSGTATNRLVRLHTDGTIDSSFDIGSGFDATINNIVIQKNGGFLIAGMFSRYHIYPAAYITSVYGNSDLVVLPNSTNTGTINTEFTSKGYSQSNGNLIGSTAISLSETDGNIPLPLHLKNQNITLSLPENVQCKKADNVTNYNGILSVPTSRSLHTIDSKPVISAFKVGSSTESIRLVGGVATLSAPAIGANIGDTVDIYYSEDNGATWYSHTNSKVIEYNGQAYVTFTTNHFTDFAVTLPPEQGGGSFTGTFTINNDTASTTSQIVTLNISTTPPAVQMRFSDDGTNWPARENYATTKSRTLPGTYGSKTVYAQFDADGDNTADITTQDSINYTEGGVGGGTSQGQLTLEIGHGTGSCQYGTSLNLGAQVAGYSAKIFSGSFASSFRCEDKNGTIDDRVLSIQSSLLTNASNSNYTIPAMNVELQNSPAHIVNGNCAIYTGTTSRTPINSPTSILGKNHDMGAICKIQADTVTLKVTTATNQAVGIYTGTLTIDVPNFN